MMTRTTKAVIQTVEKSLNEGHGLFMVPQKKAKKAYSRVSDHAYKERKEMTDRAASVLSSK